MMTDMTFTRRGFHSFSTVEWLRTLECTRTGLLSSVFQILHLCLQPICLGMLSREHASSQLYLEIEDPAWASMDISLPSFPLSYCPNSNTLLLVLRRVDLAVLTFYFHHTQNYRDNKHNFHLTLYQDEGLYSTSKYLKYLKNRSFRKTKFMCFSTLCYALKSFFLDCTLNKIYFFAIVLKIFFSFIFMLTFEFLRENNNKL